ncbi:M24 family metallopeptidase [Nitrospinota bacterium]
MIPPTDRKMKHGDAVVLEISPRVEGYWNQIVRVLTIGPAAQWLTDAYEVVRLARQEALKHLRPAEPMAALSTAMKTTIEAHGYTMKPPASGTHLTGLDLTDLRITEKTTQTFMPGMAITVHPMMNLGLGRQLFWGETYLVTATGYEPLNRCADKLTFL